MCLESIASLKTTSVKAGEMNLTHSFSGKGYRVQLKGLSKENKLKRFTLKLMLVAELRIEGLERSTGDPGRPIRRLCSWMEPLTQWS